MRTKNFGEFYLRRYPQIEGTLDNESGVRADGESVRKLVIGAAIRNSFSGQFVENLHSAVLV
jgi:hypothetical protein